jgi:hypothetical protein
MHKAKRKNSDIPRREPIQWGEWFGYLWQMLTWPFVAGWQAIAWLVQHGWKALAWSVRNGWNASVWLVQHGWKAFAWTVKGVWMALTWVTSGIWSLVRYLVVGHVPEFKNSQEEFAFWRIKRRYRRRRFLMIHGVVTILALFGLGLRWMDMSRFYADIGREMPAYIGQQQMIFGLLMIVLFGMHMVWARLGNAEDDDIQQALNESHQRTKTQVYEEHYRTPQRLIDQTDHDDDYYADNPDWQEQARYSR